MQFLVLAGQLPELLLEPLDSHFRVAVIGLQQAVAIEAGTLSSCAVLADGFVQCWGAAGVNSPKLSRLPVYLQ